MPFTGTFSAISWTLSLTLHSFPTSPMISKDIQRSSKAGFGTHLKSDLVRSEEEVHLPT